MFNRTSPVSLIHLELWIASIPVPNGPSGCLCHLAKAGCNVTSGPNNLTTPGTGRRKAISMVWSYGFLPEKQTGKGLSVMSKAHFQHQFNFLHVFYYRTKPSVFDTFETTSSHRYSHVYWPMAGRSLGKTATLTGLKLPDRDAINSQCLWHSATICNMWKYTNMITVHWLDMMLDKLTFIILLSSLFFSSIFCGPFF